MTHTDEIIEKTERYGANNYHHYRLLFRKHKGFGFGMRMETVI